LGRERCVHGGVGSRHSHLTYPSPRHRSWSRWSATP
jgi:hypothetical protein